MKYDIRQFGSISGKSVDLITVSNSRGLSVCVTNYGCIVTSLIVPDRNGELSDVVLGYKTLDNYLAGHPFFGAIAGRCANRIHEGRFELDGNVYQLETNELPTGQHLHGGSNGFDKAVWGYDIEEQTDRIMIHLHRVSPDGEAGYPGTLDVVHTIGLDEDNQLHYNFRAHTDQPTIVNLVNHSYYNLAGHDQGTVANHTLQINAAQFTPVNEKMIPTGELKNVQGSGLDFQNGSSIAANMELMPAGAIDHNFILNGEADANGYRVAAILSDPSSGRQMRVKTTQPAIQFYNGFKLSNKVWIGRNGHKYEAFEGLCLETQHYPDSPNHSHFPTIRLNPGECYEQKTIHEFSVI